MKSDANNGKCITDKQRIYLSIVEWLSATHMKHITFRVFHWNFAEKLAYVNAVINQVVT